VFIKTYQNVNDFLDVARPILQRYEVENSLLLGVSTRLRTVPNPDQPYLATVADADGLLVAACMTPPYNIILWESDTHSDAALALVVQNLAGNAWAVSGVVAPIAVAHRFATLWSKETGQPVRAGMQQRLFEVKQVVPPRPVAGRLRLATANDTALVVQWVAAFHAEAMSNGQRSDAQQIAVTRIQNRDIYLWELHDTRVVTMASKTRPLGKDVSITIALVYTPPVERGKGYASNCVADLSQLLLASGWRSCNLFTDLANPISNSIYQKIGYSPLCDYNEYRFQSVP